MPATLEAETSQATEPTEYELKEYAKCAMSKIYFLTHHCKTVDVDAPAGEDKIKLIPDDKSTEEVVAFYESQDDEMLRKSRQQMASWKFMGCELHDVLFAKPNTFAFINLSILEKLVDDGTYQSLMGKAYFIYTNLPDFLKRDLERKNLSITNVITGNFIKGIATTEYAGRSGAYTGALVDEGQDVPFFRALFSSLRLAVKKRLKIIFTPPEGETDEIELMWLDKDNGFNKRQLHWSLWRSREWYEAMCKSLTQDEIDRELDLKSGSGRKARVWPSFDYEKHTKNDLYRSNLPIELSFDFGRNDLTRVDFYQVNMSEIYQVDEYSANMDTPHGYIVGICHKLAKYGRVRKEALKLWEVEGESAEAESRRRIYRAMLKEDLAKIRAFGDPAGNNKEQTSSTSPIAQYAEYGLVIQTKTQTDYNYGLDQVDLRFKELKFFIDRNNCPMSITEVQKWCYPTNRDGSRREGEKPNHDQYSHGAAAKRYFCENNPLPTRGAPIVSSTPKKPITYSRRYSHGRG